MGVHAGLAVLPGYAAVRMAPPVGAWRLPKSPLRRVPRCHLEVGETGLSVFLQEPPPTQAPGLHPLPTLSLCLPFPFWWFIRGTQSQS